MCGHFESYICLRSQRHNAFLGRLDSVNILIHEAIKKKKERVKQGKEKGKIQKEEEEQ